MLQVLPSLDGGGVERGTIEVAAAIARAGGTALVASAGGRLVPSVQKAGGRHVTLPLHSKRPWTVWLNAARLAGVVRAHNVTIVHARSRAPAWSAWLAARRTGAHFVTTYHGTYSEGFAGKRAYNAIMARGERVIAISHHIAGLVVGRHGVDPARVRVIPRGVDPAVFDPTRVGAERIRRLVAAWRLPDGAETILLPGRLTRWKGQAVLIEALALMARKDVVAVLAGDAQGRDHYAAELAARADRLGLGARVRIVGHCEDMPAALALAGVVVNASVEPEGFGRVVIEAQAMARPVVAASHGGAAETIEHDVTGWLVNPGDAAQLATALDWVLGLSAAERAGYGAAARASVEARYTTRAMQDATVAVYREVLAGVAAESRPETV